MSSSADMSVIAVDAGGTRCRTALDDGRSTIVVETGPANVSTDFDGAIGQVLLGLRKLADRAGMPERELCRLPAFVGFAGMTGPEIADRLRAVLPFSRLRIEDDRPAALRGALGSEDGVIAHCGTGSFFASQISGSMRFAGGWGSILGDEASAQWIGRLALRTTLDCVDGLCEPSSLSRRLLSDYDGAAGIVRFAGRAAPSDFGALAPIVTELAARGDILAEKVMRAGADEIARVMPQLGWAPGMTICMTGGIGRHFLQFLPAAMQLDFREARGEPLTGAIDLARILSREAAHERH